MRKILNAVCVLVASFTPTYASPPLSELRDRYVAVEVTTALEAEEEVVHEEMEPSIYLVTEPRKVQKFEQFCVQVEELPGQFRMVIYSSPPVLEWAKVSKSSR